MAADRGPLATRGRSCSPHIRAFSPYASWYPPGRDRSPHFSPDRITRYASPSQRSLDLDQDEIVPRIPQPYRTSFSAITSPQRVPKTPPPTSTRIHGVGPLARSTPARSTMPGRIVSIHAPRSQSQSQSSPPKKPPRTFQYSRPSHIQSSSDSDTINGTQDTSDYSSPKLCGAANSVLKPPRSCDQYKAPAGELMIDGRIDSVASTVDSVFSDNYGASCDTSDANTTFDSLDLDPRKICSNQSPSQPPPPDDPDVFVLFEPEKKLVIEKEYLHVIEIRHPDTVKNTVVTEQPATKSEKSTRRVLKKIFRVNKKEKKQPHSYGGKSDSEASSPQFVHTDKQRPLTTRSEELLSVVHKDRSQTKGKKSLMNIGKLFKRMSPKTLRKPDDKPELSTTSQTSSCSDSLHGEALIYQNGENRSVHSNQSDDSSSSLARTPKNSPALKAARAKDAFLQTKDSIAEEPVNPGMPSSSARILKSIGETSQGTNEKSVYRAFKEKQSPRPSTEATSLKPQALRAVEFPDTILNHAGGNTSPGVTQATSASQSPSLSSPVLPQVPFHGAGGSSSPAWSLGREESTRKQDPPQTLNVNDVSKLNKHTFAYPSMSAESIGECSLDVMGSEPSLASKNGQRSTTASKRTLTSQENITGVSLKQNSTSDDIARNKTTTSSSQSSLPPVETTPNKDVTDSSGSPKTPSYLKLSCALGGYNKYSNYGSPKTENRHRVADGLTDSDIDENTVPNGHIEPVTSNKVIVGEAKSSHSNSNSSSRGPARATVKITQNGATVTRLSNANGGVEYPPLHPKPVTYRTNGNVSSNTVTQGEDSVRPVVNGVEPSVVRTPADSECNVHDVDTSSQSVEGAGPAGVFSTPEQSRDSDSDTSTPSKDGKYFMSVVDREEARLMLLCERAENNLSNNIPEEASGKVRATIGKANLLTTKKFRQFRGLCDRNMEQDSDDQFQTTCQDLAGFWDMVLIQVEDVASMFDDIEKLRLNGWHEERNSPVQPKKTLNATPTKTRSGRPKGGATPKSAKSQEAAKIREEARRRLLEAKRAGRERKASQSDKEEVEIYVN